MEYKEVFLYSYGIALLFMFVFLFGKLFMMARRLRWNGVDSNRVVGFFWGQTPMTLMVWMWSSFLFGSLLGAIWSALNWLAR